LISGSGPVIFRWIWGWLLNRIVEQLGRAGGGCRLRPDVSRLKAFSAMVHPAVPITRPGEKKQRLLPSACRLSGNRFDGLRRSGSYDSIHRAA
jgi:hypothetical protein